MSGLSLEGFDVSPIRSAALAAAPPVRTAAIATIAEADASATSNDASVTISLSSEAKAALAGGRTASAEFAKAAIRGAREIAAVAGVSVEQAVIAAQPLRSPPPAKGAALFQANLTAERPVGG